MPSSWTTGLPQSGHFLGGGDRDALLSLLDDLDDLGDDLAGSLDQNAVPYLEAQAVDLLEVVQGDGGDRDARAKDRLDLRDGRDGAGPADRIFDADDLGGRLLGRDT